MSTPKPITVPEAAIRLGMLPRKIRRYCARGVVGKKVGRDWILTESDLAVLERFIDRPPGNSPDWKNGKEPAEKAIKTHKITTL